MNRSWLAPRFFSVACFPHHSRCLKPIPFVRQPGYLIRSAAFDAMKKLPYTFPELAFIILVVVLPMSVGIIWRRETIWGFLGQVVVSMVIGFGLWLGFVCVICLYYDRQKKKQERKQ